MDSYSDVHRAVLQYMISVKVIREYDLLELFCELIKQHEAYHDKELTETQLEALLMDCLVKINQSINPIGFNIGKSKDQTTNKLLYVYVNTKIDNSVKNATNNSAIEIDLIKKIIDAIFNYEDVAEETYKIRMGELTRLLTNESSKTNPEADNFTHRLIDEGWFSMTSEGSVIPSVRLLSELKGYLIDKYGVVDENNEGKIHLCIGCGEIVTIGEKCANDECFVRFHKNCSVLYFRSRDLGCPNGNCENNWPSSSDRENGNVPQMIGTT